MNDKIKLWVSMVIVIALFVAGFIYTGMVDDSKSEKSDGLPTRATNVIDQGNGWYSFDLEVGENVVTVVHFFEKPPVKEDTAQPIDEEFLRDWQKGSQDDSDDEIEEDVGEDDEYDE